MAPLTRAAKKQLGDQAKFKEANNNEGETFAMPLKKKCRKAKAKLNVVILTPEQQQLRDRCDQLLEDFDRQCENTVKEAWREVDTAAKSISTLYKLELLKMPQEVKDMKWDDYYQMSLDQGDNPLALSEAVDGAVNNALFGAGSTIATTSSRSRCIDESYSAITTPANKPINMGRTPMITPKFDTNTSSRIVSRVAKPNEILVSLSGSPVTVPPQNNSKAHNATNEEVAQVTLAGSSTLNIPIVEDGRVNSTYLDDEQLNKLDALQKSLSSMSEASKSPDEVAQVILGDCSRLNIPLVEDGRVHLDDEQLNSLDALQKSLAKLVSCRREADDVSGKEN